MPKFQAPEHVSEIICPSGNAYRADKAGGIAKIPEDAPEGDIRALNAAGWTAESDAPAESGKAKA